MNVVITMVVGDPDAGADLLLELSEQAGDLTPGANRAMHRPGAMLRVVADADPSPAEAAEDAARLSRRYGCTLDTAKKVPPILARKILADLERVPSRPEACRAPPAPLEDWEAFIEDAESALGMCSEVPMEGADFADSVETKLRSMIDWVRSHERVTDAMQSALDNMTEGLSRWVE